MKKTTKVRWEMGLTALGALAADQALKYGLMHRDRVLIPGVIRLTTAFNTGAAMSLFSGGGAVLAAVTVLLILAGGAFAWQRACGGLSALGCGLMLGGAVGNLVDRLLYGYVIDLFELTFVRFYIFNGADVAIVTGAALCAVSALWFEKQNWKSGKEK